MHKSCEVASTGLLQILYFDPFALSASFALVSGGGTLPEILHKPSVMDVIHIGVGQYRTRGSAEQLAPKCRLGIWATAANIPHSASDLDLA